VTDTRLECRINIVNPQGQGGLVCLVWWKTTPRAGFLNAFLGGFGAVNLRRRVACGVGHGALNVAYGCPDALDAPLVVRAIFRRWSMIAPPANSPRRIPGARAKSNDIPGKCRGWMMLAGSSAIFKVHTRSMMRSPRCAPAACDPSQHPVLVRSTVFTPVLSGATRAVELGVSNTTISTCRGRRRWLRGRNRRAGAMPPALNEPMQRQTA